MSAATRPQCRPSYLTHRVRLHDVVLAILLANATSCLAANASAASSDLDRVGAQVLQLTNAFHHEQGRAAVKPNADLASAAHDFAGYLASVGKLDHEADGKNPAIRAKEHGYDYCTIEENIADAYNSADYASDALARTLVDGWEHSPEHRKNMLEPEVTESAVGIARSATTGYYYMTPRSRC